MQIFVKAASNGHTYTIEIEPEDNAARIKNKLFEKYGLSVESHDLFFAGKRLPNDVSVEHYGIDKESILFSVNKKIYQTDEEMKFFILKNITLLAALNDTKSVLATTGIKDILPHIIKLNFDMQDQDIKRSVPYVLKNWHNDKWLRNVYELLLITQKAANRNRRLDPSAANSYMATLLREIRKNTYSDLSPDSIEDRCAIPIPIFMQMKQFIDSNHNHLIETGQRVSEEFYKSIEAEFNTNHVTSFKKFEGGASPRQVSNIPNPVYAAPKRHHDPMPLPSNPDHNDCVIC